MQGIERLMRDLRGKVAVVTGAASGIGRAMAERFGREGMRIVLADVEDGPLVEAREAIVKSGAEAIAIRTDVSRWEEVEALAVRAFDAFGAAHVVCNNAGIAFPGLTWELSQADWEWTFGVNVWGVVHGIRAFVPRLIAQGEGHIVNTASLAGLVPTLMMAHYCATKHAVVAISECLHYDLTLAAGGKVKVSVVCPGLVQTQIADCERNRPSSLERDSSRQLKPEEKWMQRAARASMAGGIAAAEVAEKVLRAVQEDRFWVLTHPEFNGAVQKHTQGILEGKTPELDSM